MNNLQSVIQRMDATMEEKQQYLRVNILEAGYDAQQFIEFLHENTSEDTPDINDITLEEIQSIVQMYRKHRVAANPPSSEETSATDSTPSKNNSAATQQLGGYKMSSVNKMVFSPDRMKMFEEKKSRIDYEKYHPLFDYELRGAVKCIESEKLANFDRLEIRVTDMESKETQGFLFGIGARTEYYYHIKSNLMKGTVKRVSEDFDWLNTTLLRLYPLLVLPELQPVRRDIKDPYLKRRQDLQEYLEYLGRKEFLLHSQVFIDFLTLSSEKMQKYKKSYDSMGFAKGVSLIKNSEGIANIELTNSIRSFYASSRKFTKRTSQLHEQLTFAFEKMTLSIRNAVSDTYAVVDLFAELHDSYAEVTNKFPTLKKQQYSDTLVNLNNLFLGIGDNFQRSADLIDKNVKEYYRFNVGLDRSISKLQKLVKDSESQYLDFKYALHKKKERVISDPSKWELDSKEIDLKQLSREQLMQMILPRDALQEGQTKSWYAYNLKNYQQEFQDYLKVLTRRYHNVFKVLATDLLASDKNYLEVITKFMGDCRKNQPAS